VARADPHDDSPIFQLIDDLPRQDIDHTKTDVFRKSVDYSKKYKDRLAAAVRQGVTAVEQIAAEPGLGNLLEVESGVVVDLFLSLRDVKAHAGMIELYHRMPVPLQRAKMMREQLGLRSTARAASRRLRRCSRPSSANSGPSSETNALLGRSYKDRWDLARKEGRPEARGLLRRAIETYLEGFQTDWRDAFPGINAVTLMEMQDKPDPRQAQLLPVVRYSATRKAEMNADIGIMPP